MKNNTVASVKKILQWLMLLSGGLSACNLLTLYFLPLIFPMANFSIVKLTFIAIVLFALYFTGQIKSIKQNIQD